MKAPEQEWFTESFAPGAADVKGWLVDFTSDGTPDHYAAETCFIAAKLPVPFWAGAAVLNLDDDHTVEVALAGRLNGRALENAEYRTAGSILQDCTGGQAKAGVTLTCGCKAVECKENAVAHVHRNHNKNIH